MPSPSSPAAADEVARLNQELAATARATAMLLIQPRHDPAELAQLDVRAKELRAAIRQAEAVAQQGEPVVLASRHPVFAPPSAGEGPAGRKPAGRAKRPRP
jgi:hypothetical protein